MPTITPEDDYDDDFLDDDPAEQGKWGNRDMPTTEDVGNLLPDWPPDDAAARQSDR